MTTRRPHTNALIRLLAGLCVLGVMGGDAVRIVHLLTVRHVVCLAHGELIEVGESAGAPSEAGGTEQQIAPEARGGTHEHCALSALATRVHAVAVTDSSGAVAPADLPILLSSPAFDARSGGAPLAYAPKQGPPV